MKKPPEILPPAGPDLPTTYSNGKTEGGAKVKDLSASTLQDGSRVWLLVPHVASPPLTAHLARQGFTGTGGAYLTIACPWRS